MGLPAARVRRLLERLVACGALAATEPDPALSHRGLGAEVDHWSRATGADVAPTLAHRTTTTVGVLGLDRVGLALAGILAAAGVGTILVEDPRRVRRDELGTGYLAADVGHRRADRARAALRSAHPHLRLSAAPGTRPDLVVLVEQDVSDPVRQRPLMREDVDHLLVVSREVDVVVGPLVTPGRGSCGRCVDLHRTDADDRWPALATQLLGAARRGVETTSAVVAAGLAAGQVLAHLDGRPVSTASTSLLVDPRRPVPRTQQWPLHPQCGCSGLLPRDEPDRGPAVRRPATASGDGGVLPGPASAALGRHDLAADEDLAAPDAPRLLTSDGAAQAGLADRAASA
ncbi:ThiF family adenylyltransferase [Georgenia sunbinii]|uniref:ThiF family adenylyltransferase n=1 Tax=Georgenia sunbinii TaxID=3117728 RepID=UPI003D9C4B5C